MSWAIRLRRLPLRTKLWITLVGAGIALLGLSTYLSFGYWKTEALAATEQQALLAAGSARTAVENGLRYGDRQQARRALKDLTRTAAVTGARVYGPNGAVVVSTVAVEEGLRQRGTWLPDPQELPVGGVVRDSRDGAQVHAFVPLRIPEPALLEVEFSVAPLRAAMDRGARLGLGLVIGSVLALAAVLFTMLEREVVAPMERVADMVGASGTGHDGIVQLEASVAELVQTAERAEAERQQFAEREGFAQVGELAAEMAHEFKRPLATVRTALDLLQQEYVLDDRGQAVMGAVSQQLDHLAETMRDLFSLAKPVTLEAEEVGLSEALDDALFQMAGHPALAGVQVVRDYGAGNVRVPADRKRLEQAVLNLVLNAVEAMPKGGTLTLRTRCEGADLIEIEVQDTGVGIPAGELEKITLPFYSTKPSGTGLGLPLVTRVVAAHGGALLVESEPGKGTRVRVRLPVRGVPVRMTEAASWQTQESWS